VRLARIKLAGFKSFVDPTLLVLPGNRVGIVGPNGCGKSNTIDAVRWVRGESSAKHLRGDSSDDVIFNGSASRKPVGQASIELFFDLALRSDRGLQLCRQCVSVVDLFSVNLTCCFDGSFRSSLRVIRIGFSLPGCRLAVAFDAVRHCNQVVTLNRR
jgi:energy-coupling factor transporter ATP-binding protein EcfA2